MEAHTPVAELSGFSLEVPETVRQIQEIARRFAHERIAPKVRELDETQTFPTDLLREAGELGLMGIFIPQEYGGAGLGYYEYAAALIELGAVDGAFGLSVAAHNSLCTGHIYYHGSEEQKRKYLPKLASGEWLGAWALTEPNTGSDASNMDTVAVRDGDGWRITGQKNFITHGISADVYVVIARTGERRARSNATAFIIEKGTPGLIPGKKEDKLGMRASETSWVGLDNVWVPDTQRIGEVGDGFHQAMQVLDGGRISIAALALGIARGAYDAALTYAQQRRQFDKPLIDHQMVAFKLADMAMELAAAELLIYQAAYRKNTGQPVTRYSSMAKYYASEVGVKICNEAVQIFGGYGYVKDYPVEKYYRDIKLCTIGEGTSEIQLLVISRDFLREAGLS
ncbi:MAG: acyl-CoA dehydrogenase family protein [Bacteroidia bacterium]|nr:acyl-CoA dehydrogenase family protein [Bacteroidia bacterium]MCX7651758.1 acyl-CoA dehydrogenase family protein [Bacteroidia bacterium]MDW8416370.1 acyl-CoA dehydrogenase family protein [Bacteroidia bacterium]